MFYCRCFFPFFYSPGYASELVRRPIAVKLCHVIAIIWVRFMMQIQKFGEPSPQRNWGQNMQNSRYPKSERRDHQRFLLGSSTSMIGWPATERNNGKKNSIPYFNARTVTEVFAVYGCNGTEFSCVVFIEQRNFTTAERLNGNGRTATEWWKPGIRASGRGMSDI